MHTPVQLPPEQTNGQVAPLIQNPELPQVWGTVGCVGLHRLVVGVHSPQRPAPTHVKGGVQAISSFHTPPGLQSWGVLILHCRVPGTHMPVQLPPLQT